MKIVNTNRPWGCFEQFTLNEVSTVKLHYVNKGESTSLQFHNKRDEFWKVVKGSPEITIGENVFTSEVGDEYDISAGTAHRISAPNDDVVILEISLGDFDEEDIVRLEDKYNRIS